MVENMENELYIQATEVMDELCEKSNLKPGNIVIVGCSTSEIIGSGIGTNSSPETAGIVFKGLLESATRNNVFLAVQCCEHLNRAVVIEKDAVSSAETVNVIPQPKAGGSMATQAYKNFKNPVVVEEIHADAGIDIGFTLIGMHLKKVAVPLRLKHCKIGEAMVLAARTRPKFIGGIRAVYDDTML